MACAVLTLPVFGLLAFSFVPPLVSTIWLGITYSFAAVSPFEFLTPALSQADNFLLALVLKKLSRTLVADMFNSQLNILIIWREHFKMCSEFKLTLLIYEKLLEKFWRTFI